MENNKLVCRACSSNSFATGQLGHENYLVIEMLDL